MNQIIDFVRIDGGLHCWNFQVNPFVYYGAGTLGGWMLLVSERRVVIRHRTFKAGKIVLNGTQSVVDCTIRNISNTGARLSVVSVIGIPDRFVLSIESEQCRRPCEVVRRQATELGVRFEV